MSCLGERDVKFTMVYKSYDVCLPPGAELRRARYASARHWPAEKMCLCPGPPQSHAIQVPKHTQNVASLYPILFGILFTMYTAVHCSPNGVPRDGVSLIWNRWNTPPNAPPVGPVGPGWDIRGILFLMLVVKHGARPRCWCQCQPHMCGGGSGAHLPYHLRVYSL